LICGAAQFVIFGDFWVDLEIIRQI